MKILKNILIALAISVVILLIVIIYLKSLEKKENNNIVQNNQFNSYIIEEPESDLESQDTYVITNKDIELVNNRNKYYAIKDIVNSHITEEIIINNMYSIKKTTNIDIFWVDFIKKADRANSNIMVITDSLNNTYLVLDENQIRDNNYTLEVLESVKVESVENNGNNVLEYKNIADETYAKELLKDYIEKALFDTNLGYGALNENYKQKKFGTFEEYNNYIIKNENMLNLYDAKNVKGPDEFATYEEWLSYFNTIKLLELDKYLITKRDGYTEYNLIDTYGNNYIFNEKSVMNYEVLLDTYTTTIPAFIEKYNEQEDEQKVRMNIYKFYDAITDGDYKYAYNTLSDILKNDKFLNQTNFETYIKGIYLTEEAINESEVEKTEQDSFICKVNISKDETVKELNFKVALLQDTEFSILDIY